MCLTTENVCAQQEVITQNQIWLGYMTTVQVSKKYLLWNDIQFVPSALFLLRTGLTKDMKLFNVTGGYAYGRLAVSSSNTNLDRIEHRPWAQAQGAYTLPKEIVLIPRLRYDARFRQDVTNGKLIDSYSFVNRIRFMLTVRKFLTANETSIGKPFISLSEELLLNFGKNVISNHFDQNRISLMVGTKHKNIQIQIGYMNRFVKTGTEQFLQYHTLVIWFTHRFGVNHLKTENDVELDGE